MGVVVCWVRRVWCGMSLVEKWWQRWGVGGVGEGAQV